MKKIWLVIMSILFVLSLSFTGLQAGEMSKGNDTASESAKEGEMKSAEEEGESEKEAEEADEESNEEAAKEGEHGAGAHTEKSGH